MRANQRVLDLLSIDRLIQTANKMRMIYNIHNTIQYEFNNKLTNRSLTIT